MDVRCLIIELKSGSRDKVYGWADFIRANKGGALATLENEGPTRELLFFSVESKDYLAGYMRAKSMAHAHEALKRSLSEVDAYHQQFKQDTLIAGTETELMFDLSRTPNESGLA